MCGIAGYSLHSRSDLERTLAAQALLAAIAERGADAVGYAYRNPHETYATVVKQRTPASQLLDRVSVPQEVNQLLVHVRDYTKGHPRSPPTTTRCATGRWWGSITGSSRMTTSSLPPTLARASNRG